MLTTFYNNKTDSYVKIQKKDSCVKIQEKMCWTAIFGERKTQFLRQKMYFFQIAFTFIQTN